MWCVLCAVWCVLCGVSHDRCIGFIFVGYLLGGCMFGFLVVLFV